MARRTRWLAAAAVVAAVATAGVSVATAAPEKPGAGPAADRPNVIYVLVDDMSADLLKHMDNVRGLTRHGTRFDNYIVSNSLCCPSRASMFTGLFPHNSGVLTNLGADHGGYEFFKKWENRTYAHVLHKAGYRTGYLGKYINEYKVGRDGFRVPDGRDSWDEWHVASGGGYNEFTYRLTRYVREQNVRDIGDGDGKYLVDVLGERATKFVDRSEQLAPNKPFFLQVAPFSPHGRPNYRPGEREPRFPPARRDRPGAEFEHGDCGGVDCRSLDVRDLPAFNEDTEDKKDLPWIRQKALGGPLIKDLNNDFRNRVRMVQSIDDMVGKVVNHLSPRQRRNTYVVFGSDNGFHLGQHRMLRGKSTAYDNDVRIPMIVARPAGVGPDRAVVRKEIVQNVDLYATLLDIAEVGPPQQNARDGRSLLGLVRDDAPQNWRNAALIEHRRPRLGDGDPDADKGGGPASYKAIRVGDPGGTRELFVQYLFGEKPREFYNRAEDPYELRNKPNHERIGDLAPALRKLGACGGTGENSCWKAAHVDMS